LRKMAGPQLFWFSWVQFASNSPFRRVQMRLKNAFLGSMMAMGLLFGSLAYAQNNSMKAPAENISSKKHPNLAAAQHHLDMAFEKVQAAQQANEFDLAGHAAKAKELIDQADKELKMAAETANKEHK
jgi:F0F1-type ATP synthase membrane subunit b/b'